MRYNKIQFCFFLVFISIARNLTIYADDFTDMLQDLAVQTACLGSYSNAEAKIYNEKDPIDYYTPSIMAERFAEMSGERTRIETFYGICFDYANCAYEHLEKHKDSYAQLGMYEDQFWIAVSISNSNIIELTNPVSKEEGNFIMNGVPIETYGEYGRFDVKTHDNITHHGWLWVQRFDGVLFWIDPTWTDNLGYVVYGYVGNGKEIQCRPNRELCINYPSKLNQLPDPPKVGKFPNSTTYRDPVLVDEKAIIRDKECFYWKFTVPENSEYIEISCTTDAILHSIMTFAVVPSEDDIIHFHQACDENNVQFHYITGTYKKNTQSYSVKLQGLTPGETYYFCAFKGFAFFSRIGYEIKCTIRTW